MWAMTAGLAPGLRAGFDHTVTDADTAAALGSGLVPVLSTPTVLALMERATVEALAGALQQGATTVGARVELEHLLPTVVGATVHVAAILERVEGRRLHFGTEVREGDRVAASGQITRVVVDRARFLAGPRPS
jgi:fluoroacetyl-CoA thioesterase